MKRSLSFLLGIVAVVTAVPLLYAGQKTRVPVLVVPQYHYFYGSIGSTRNTTGTVERLSCSLYGDANFVRADCSAIDANNNQAYCYAEKANLVRLIESMKGDYLFVMYDDTGQCTYVYATVDSAIEPKAP